MRRLIISMGSVTLIVGSQLSLPLASHACQIAPESRLIARPISVISQDEEAASTDEEAAGPIVEASRTQPEVPPGMLRLTLRDGTVITGKVANPTLTVQTDFGSLTIPVDRIRRLNPGLCSYPTLEQELKLLVEQLADANFETREQAQKSLIDHGARIRDYLSKLKEVDDAERKKRLAVIMTALDQQTEDLKLLGEAVSEQPLSQLDVVQTDVFTLAGKVQLDAFELSSKYGQLNVKLADILEADRMWGQSEVLRKGLVLQGNSLAPNSFKSTQIRINKGDRITVSAEGRITMTPWGSNQFATPDGNQYFGMYGSFPGGALLASIGPQGKEIAVGARKSWVAESSGVLRFGIAMQPDYAGGNYQFPGEYTLKIQVEPN